MPRAILGSYSTSEGDLAVTDAGKGRLKVAISVVSGPNAHLCDFDETLVLKGNTATFHEPDEDGACVLTLRFAGNSVFVDQTGTCGCGAQAQMGGTYLRDGTFKGRAPHPAKGAALERLQKDEKAETAGIRRLEGVLQGARFTKALPLLSNCEQRWNVFREANAEMEGDFSRGTPWGEVLMLMAKEEATTQRTHRIESFLLQEGVDPDIPSIPDFQAQLSKIDARLNRAYREFRDRLDETGKRKLLTAQQAWIKYRNAQTAFEAERWGYGYTAFRLMSLERLTLERCLQLEASREAYTNR